MRGTKHINKIIITTHFRIMRKRAKFANICMFSFLFQEYVWQKIRGEKYLVTRNICCWSALPITDPYL